MPTERDLEGRLLLRCGRQERVRTGASDAGDRRWTRLRSASILGWHVVRRLLVFGQVGRIRKRRVPCRVGQIGPGERGFGDGAADGHRRRPVQNRVLSKDGALEVSQ
jgi:hypothetical protein